MTAGFNWLEESGEIYFNDLKFTPEEWASIKRVHIVACGTSWHAGLVGKFLLERTMRDGIDLRKLLRRVDRDRQHHQ